MIKQRPALTRDQQILSLSSVVQAVAKTYVYSTPKSITFQELESAAWRGAIEAVDTFDPERHTFLAVFAKKRIRGAILDYLRGLDHLTREHRRDIKSGKLPPIHLVSTVQTNNEGEECHFDLPYVDVFPERFEESDTTNRLRETLTQLIAVSALSARSRQVLNAYYFQGRTLKHIGQSIGVHESRTNQLLRSALGALRDTANGKVAKVPKQSKWIEYIQHAAKLDIGQPMLVSTARTLSDVQALRCALGKHPLTVTAGWSIALTTQGACVTKRIKHQPNGGPRQLKTTSQESVETYSASFDTKNLIPPHPSEAKFADLSLRFYSEEQELSEAEWAEINDKVLPKMASEIALHGKAKEKTHAVLDPWLRKYGNDNFTLKAKIAIAELYVAVYDQIMQERLEARAAVDKVQEQLRLAKLPNG